MVADHTSGKLYGDLQLRHSISQHLYVFLSKLCGEFLKWQLCFLGKTFPPNTPGKNYLEWNKFADLGSPVSVLGLILWSLNIHMGTLKCYRQYGGMEDTIPFTKRRLSADNSAEISYECFQTTAQWTRRPKICLHTLLGISFSSS